MDYLTDDYSLISALCDIMRGIREEDEEQEDEQEEEMI